MAILKQQEVDVLIKLMLFLKNRAKPNLQNRGRRLRRVNYQRFILRWFYREYLAFLKRVLFYFRYQKHHGQHKAEEAGHQRCQVGRGVQKKESQSRQNVEEDEYDQHRGSSTQADYSTSIQLGLIGATFTSRAYSSRFDAANRPHIAICSSWCCRRCVLLIKTFARHLHRYLRLISVAKRSSWSCWIKPSRADWLCRSFDFQRGAFRLLLIILATWIVLAELC